jgi:hypothetical protein
MNTDCSSCDMPSPKASKHGYGLMTGLLLALLPKCPFCIMAFTGTAVLCGEGSVVEISRTHNSLLTILVTGVLCLVTCMGIALNRRGNRTMYALAIAAAGISMIMFSVIRSGGQPVYYGGITLVFFAVWLNGSLLWFVRKLGVKSSIWSKAGTVSEIIS